MRQKGAICGLITALIAGVLFSACTRQASTAPAVIPATQASIVPQPTPTDHAPSAPTVAPSLTQLPTFAVTPSSTAVTTPISISRVQVTQQTGIYILGKTSLADGKCIQTELLADQQPVTWWPRDVCIQIESGQWEILVPLGRRGAPAQLNSQTKYALHAWLPEDAQRINLTLPLEIK